MLEFIYTLQANSDFTQTLDYSAKEAKLTTSFEDEYMYFIDIVEEEKEYARQIGHAEGLAKGLAEGEVKGHAKGFVEGIMKIAKNMKTDNIPMESIVRLTGLTEEEISKL